ncbi:MAG: hypothetical protein ABFD12_01430, partial [Syntrophorhabdus sp.]
SDLRENDLFGIGAVDALVHDVKFCGDEEISVAFQGHLTNKREILAAEGIPVERGAESGIIKHLYVQYGQNINQKLKGKYCFALWDARSRRMLLSADRYGYGCLYYYQDEHWCVFATEIKAILKVLDHTPEPNINGICDIYNFHTVYGNDTPFQNIYLLPYGSFAELWGHGMQLKRYWEYPMYQQHEERIEEELLELTKEKMLDSVRNAIQDHEHVGIMITSGLDSRWIAGAVDKLFPDKNTFLYHINNGREDLSAIKNMSRVLGMPLILRGDEKKDLTEKALAEYVHLTDGHWAPYEFMAGIQELRKQYDDVVLFNGYLCDVSFQPSILRSYYTSKSSDMLKTTLECFSFLPDYLSDGIFTNGFAAKLRRRKSERIEETLLLFSKADPVFQALRFYNINRGRRHVYFWMKAINCYVKLATPGTDYDLYDFAMKIPRQFRENAKFYIASIVQLFPELGDIVWNKTGKPLRLGSMKKSKAAQKFVPLMKYALQRLTHGKIDLSNPPSSFDRLFRQNKVFRDQVCALLLDEKATGRGFYNRAGFERLISLQLSGRDYGGLFESMITVECLFRRFFD